MRDSAEANLEIQLFGGFDVRVGKALLPPLRSQKSRWLLALLILRHGQVLQRTNLAALLWPDSLQTEALASLRQCIFDLRQALQQEAYRLEVPAPRSLRLNLGNATIDLLEFDRCVAKADPVSLEAACALYRGPLLPDCSELWIFPERETRLQAYLKAIAHRAAAARADGDLKTCRELLTLGVSANPLDESLCHELMQVQIRTSDYAAAAETYLTLRDRLYADLQMEPQPETTALYHALRAHARRSPEIAGGMPSPTGSTGRIPAPLTQLIGRKQEMQAILMQLFSARLVTLTGMGGVGKTRLAIEIATHLAHDYSHGVWFVDLSNLTMEDLLPQTIATLLGVVPSRGRSWLDTLVDYLRPRQLLLLLDNCEHVLSACTQLTRTLLEACPHIKILATSRQKLGLWGEMAFPLTGLAVTDPVSTPTLAVYLDRDAIRLFYERAVAVKPAFALTEQNTPIIFAICQRLDGLPLALELAAALVEIQMPEEILECLASHADLASTLESAQPDRHHSLEIVMDGSYRLLTPAEQTLFRRLGLFVGAWTLPSARSICANNGLDEKESFPLLARLVSKSLVVAITEKTETRYTMLETVRRYSRRKLEASGECTALLHRFQDYFVALAREAEPHLTGREQSIWLNELDLQHQNLRAALQPLDTSPTQLRKSLCLTNALGRFWQIRGEFSEASAHLSRLLEQSEMLSMGAERADALNWASLFAAYQGDYSIAQDYAEQGLTTWKALEDESGVAGSLGCLGIIAANRGDYLPAYSLFQESLHAARKAKEDLRIAGALGYLGIVSAALGDYEKANAFYQESYALRQQQGDTWGIAASLNNLGLLARLQGDTKRAGPLLEQSLTLRRSLADRRCIAITLNILGTVACEEGDLTGAEKLLSEGLILCREIGDRRSIAYALEALAWLAHRNEDLERSVRLLGTADAIRKEIGAPLPPSEQADFDQRIQLLRHDCGEPMYNAWWTEGQANGLLPQ